MSAVPRHVSVEWLHEHLADPTVRVLDATVHLSFDEDGAHVASGRESYERGHVPGAAFVDQLTSLSDPGGEAPFAAVDTDRFAAVVGAAGVGDEHHVVVYDSVNGIWATRLWWQFGLEGNDRVSVLDGGLDAWRAAGYETTTGTETYPPTTFTARRRPERITSTADVEAAVADPDVLLVNALGREEFERGRIPGSVNVPFGELVGPDGRMRPVEELRELFESVGALDAGKRPVTYCGGGIAATAAALALMELGRDDVAVYDGSMNAWTADPNRPLER
ncbi:sulfurtransferase [Nocardioides sp. zg-579]|uniref:Sulfurtransferase n=1 Tax=Nocardioides marmotae TaxID=2663857 RepID=A0A6I3JA14_9ACTN|nr:rhodanese-like domain-containing protein [Nocardioides marmotae]MCR6031099.1 sulfurtransferase [Gordonia jinghuaiqii]MTB94738.1 sulfurtransferase [Nocardioides marmotae]QKE01265.1 sulfurtransferase [Nocardioides marmotae]